MSSNEIPEPWRSRLIERQFTDPRYSDDRPSLSRLANAMDMHTSTVASAIYGRRRASEETVAGLVKHLGEDVAAWLERLAPRPWNPPAESALLTDRQRKAVEELIRSMTERQENANASQERQTQAPPMNQAAGSAAHEDNVVDLPSAAYPLKGSQSAGRAARHEQDEQGES